jgi:ABC-type microcin C transport system duplicated ATPase subunit YejF
MRRASWHRCAAILVAERVALRAAGIGEKSDGVAAVLKRIEDHAEAVAEVALQLVGDQPIGLVGDGVI